MKQKLLSSVALAILMAGCAQTPTQIAYTTFGTIGATENAAINIAANLKAKNLITDAQWQQVAGLHDQFINAYTSAINVAITVTGNGNTATMTAPASLVALGNNIATIVTTFQTGPPNPAPVTNPMTLRPMMPVPTNR